MTPPRLVLGTFNQGKVREIADMLRGLPLEVVGLDAFPGVQEVEETGATFEENARLKALGLAQQTGALVLAEDSGLEVDALSGRPGVLSARYGGEGLDDAGRAALLLQELRGVPEAKRTARFRCVAAMADAERVHIVVSGKAEGRIAVEPAGESGFGYDPVFVPEGYGATFAQLGLEVKARVSHRAQAMAAFRRELAAWLDQK